MDISGHFYDGKISKTRAVLVSGNGSWATIEYANVRLKIDIQKAKIQSNGPDNYAVDFGDGGLLICKKRELEKLFPGYIKRSLQAKLSDHRVVVFAIVALALFILAPILLLSWNAEGINNLVVEQISEETEADIGDAVYDQFLVGREINPELSTELGWFAREIGLPEEIEITVVEESSFNAVSFPGRHIIVFSGVIEAVESPAELAALLGHEYGHICHRHGLKSMIGTLATSVLVQVVFGFPESGDLISRGLGELWDLSYSRSLEEEADEYAISVLNNVGLDIRGVVDLMDLLEDESNVNLPEFLSTHPITENRRERLNAVLLDWEDQNKGDFNPVINTVFAGIKGMQE
ncbi:MAG: putative Zn-dependent protease [Sphingobacteriales bacterium]|jgi:predicted Zn-dependent protease